MASADVSEVLLQIPARAPYARIVRVGAAALALRQGMGFGEIDDLRLAIDEAMIVLLDGLDQQQGIEIQVVFRITPGRFELVATRGEGLEMSGDAVERFEAIAGDLVDTYDIEPAFGRVRLVKTPIEPDA